jgi:thiol-disulfide isomerase/thioredoxin
MIKRLVAALKPLVIDLNRFSIQSIANRGLISLFVKQFFTRDSNSHGSGHARIALAAAGFVVSTAVWAEDPITQISPDDLKVILAEEEGNIVVLNLWATWCAPCIVEIPHLQEMEANLAEDGVTLIGISVDDPRGSTDFISAMRDRRFPGFRTYARDQRDVDYLVSVVDPAWNEVVPTTYVIGRDGDVLKRIQGQKTLEEFTAEVSAFID